MKRHPHRPLLVGTALLALAACGKPSGAPAQQETHASGPAPAASTSNALAEHVDTARYRIDITYPPLAPESQALMQALHHRSKAARGEFMHALPDPKQRPEFAHRQLQLKIDYRVTSRTPVFISVRERGMMDTGGAHPVPLDGTFVFDSRTQQLVTLDDLFADPGKARAALAGYARTVLEKDLLSKVPGGDKTPAKVRKVWQDNMRSMIEAGTRPTAANIREFLVDAGSMDRPGGLVLVFPPYQVAPYVYGPQTVDVPFKVFADALKPTWRAAFGLEP